MQRELLRLSESGQQQRNRIIDVVARLREDVQFLAGTSPLEGIARVREADGIDPLNGDTERICLDRLQTIFMSFNRRRPEYAQVRFIDYENGGFERVRVGCIASNLLVPTAQRDLQRKGDSGYA